MFADLFISQNKRVHMVVVLLVLLFTLSVTPLSAMEGPPGTLYLKGEKSVYEGETLSLDLVLNTPIDITSFSVILRFPERSFVEPEAVMENGSTKHTLTHRGEGEIEITYRAGDAAPIIKAGQSVLLRLEFKALNKGEGNIYYTYADFRGEIPLDIRSEAPTWSNVYSVRAATQAPTLTTPFDSSGSTETSADSTSDGTSESVPSDTETLPSESEISTSTIIEKTIVTDTEGQTTVDTEKSMTGTPDISEEKKKTASNINSVLLIIVVVLILILGVLVYMNYRRQKDDKSIDTKRR
ncbi:MAG: hypothetical protein GX907_01125 [Clostridiaceae bacterium]|nr:hypothetical protein [Clostridiaceae bacterium]